MKSSPAKVAIVVLLGWVVLSWAQDATNTLELEGARERREATQSRLRGRRALLEEASESTEPMAKWKEWKPPEGIAQGLLAAEARRKRDEAAAIAEGKPLPAKKQHWKEKVKEKGDAQWQEARMIALCLPWILAPVMSLVCNPVPENVCPLSCVFSCLMVPRNNDSRGSTPAAPTGCRSVHACFDG